MHYNYVALHLLMFINVCGKINIPVQNKFGINFSHVLDSPCSFTDNKKKNVLSCLVLKSLSIENIKVCYTDVYMHLNMHLTKKN